MTTPRTLIAVSGTTVDAAEVDLSGVDQRFQSAWVLDGAAVTYDVAKLVTARKAELDAIRQEKQERGYLHADGFVYHSDDGGRGSISQAVQLAEKYEAANGVGTWGTESWRTKGTGFTSHNLTSLTLVGLGLGAWIDGHFARQKALEAALDAAAEDPDDPAAAVLAVDLTTGWPD